MEELKVIENGLVPVYETDTGEKVVYGSELHATLEVKSRFADWVKNRLKGCEAIENEDFEAFSKILEKGHRPQIEYIIKLDTAKEMAMMERNEKGKQVRRYFIQLEKKYRKMQQEMAKPMALADDPVVQGLLEEQKKTRELLETLLKQQGRILDVIGDDKPVLELENQKSRKDCLQVLDRKSRQRLNAINRLIGQLCSEQDLCKSDVFHALYCALEDKCCVSLDDELEDLNSRVGMRWESPVYAIINDDYMYELSCKMIRNTKKKLQTRAGMS